MSYPGTTSTAITDREINHALIARRAASEGIVLLENNGILPLEEGAKVALYGGGASFTVKGGTGSGMVNNRTNISITEGMKKAGFTLTTEDWLVAYENAYHATWEAWKNRIYELSGKPGDRMGLYRAHASNPMKMPLGDPITKTDTDTAIYVISRISGEGADRKAVKGDYYLSDDEMDQLKTITTLYPNTIVVLNVGGIIDLSFLETYSISALVLLSQAGMEGGNALADVLSGKVVPSGKLTDSWAYHYEDYPSSRNFSHNNGNIIEEFYTDGIFVGYKYFDSFGILPRYPIGYGRSYSRFDVTAGDLACCDDQVRLKVKVVNRGPFAAKQSVQLFAYLPGGDKAYPLREKELRRMVAFAKTDLLQVGGEQVLELAFPADLLSSYWTARSQVYMDAGLYALELESCDAAGRLVKTPAGLLRVSAFTVLDTLQSICPLVDSLKEIRPDPALIDSLRQSAITAQSALSPLLLDETLEKTILRIRKTHEEDHARALPFAKEVEEILSKMTPRQKSETVCGQPGALSGEIIGSAAITVPGAAGETTHTLAGLGVSHLILADGPAGLRLQKHYQVNPEDGSIYQMSWYEALENRIFGKEYLHEGAEDHYQFCSAIPVGTLLAQTYDIKLMEEVGSIIGREMEELGVQVWLAPGMNIHRNPLCGRNFEYYSEDPLLSGKMAAAITRGVEGHPGCIVTIKHFACNNQEENRRGVSSIVSERALRELYLKGFEIAVKEAHPGAIMTSYNKLNGVHTANSYDLCTIAARREWGFTGIIMTDWTTTNSSGGSAAVKCITAGNDLIMPGNPSDMQEILDALEDKYDLSLPMEALDDCVRRMLSMTLRLTRKA